MVTKIQLKVELPLKLVSEVEEIILAKGLTLNEVVRLYLRALVTSNEKNKALGWESEMPFGKYRGEVVRVVALTDPDYMDWFIGGTKAKFTPEALQLFEHHKDGTV